MQYWHGLEPGRDRRSVSAPQPLTTTTVKSLRGVQSLRKHTMHNHSETRSNGPATPRRLGLRLLLHSRRLRRAGMMRGEAAGPRRLQTNLASLSLLPRLDTGGPRRRLPRALTPGTALSTLSNAHRQSPQRPHNSVGRLDLADKPLKARSNRGLAAAAGQGAAASHHRAPRTALLCAIRGVIPCIGAPPRDFPHGTASGSIDRSPQGVDGACAGPVEPTGRRAGDGTRASIGAPMLACRARSLPAAARSPAGLIDSPRRN